LTIKPIGIVKSRVKEKQAPDYGWPEVVSEVVVDSCFTEALDGLEGFSHIIVIYWLHRSDDPARMALKVHPRARQDMSPVGLFASRCPYRPNPLGQKVARLLERRGNILRVQGLDAIDGTPVMDIKPYIPGYDSVADATVPPWMERK